MWSSHSCSLTFCPDEKCKGLRSGTNFQNRRKGFKEVPECSVWETNPWWGDMSGCYTWPETTRGQEKPKYEDKPTTPSPPNSYQPLSSPTPIWDKCWGSSLGPWAYFPLSLEGHSLPCTPFLLLFGVLPTLSLSFLLFHVDLK